MRSTFFAVLLLSIALAGCGLQNISRNFELDPEGEKGILVFSLSRSGIVGIVISAQIRGVGHSYKDSVVLPEPSGGNDWDEDCSYLKYIKFHKERCNGKLYVVLLPEGDYEFYSFFGEGSTPQTWESVSLSVTPGRLQSFSVEAGQVIYAGNIHFGFLYILKTGNITYYIETVDREKRDMALFHQRYNNIAPELVTKKIAY